MDAASEKEGTRSMNHSTPEGSKRPKRQMKTPRQLEALEKTYAMETYPSEATRAELSADLGLTDRQLQMWFCHRRLKEKRENKEAMSGAPTKRQSAQTGRKRLNESSREEMMAEDPTSVHCSGSGSGSGSASGSGTGPGSGTGSGSGSSEFGNGDDTPVVPTRYYDSPRTIMEQRVIACVEAQLGGPIREDGPTLGVEFDELPPGAFGAPIVTTDLQDRFKQSYDKKLYGQYDAKHFKVAPVAHHDSVDSKIRTDVPGQGGPSFYDSPMDGHIPPKTKLPLMPDNGHMNMYLQTGRQMQICSSPMDAEFLAQDDDNLLLERKRKGDEPQRDVQAHGKKIQKEHDKQDLLRRKREEQVKKEMERLDRERRKEEQRIMREQQKQEEKFQREERREMERREKFMQKELLREERKKQKEERRREKEAERQKAAMEKATARRIAKESMELIEDERLELMELAAASKDLPSILSLDYDTLQNLESFRDALCQFPPKSVQLKRPFAIKPWMGSEKNIGNLLMVWKFCVTFSDILGLWPFTLDEFLQAFHDYESRLLGEIHIGILKLIVKDIEDVVRTPSGGPGTNQYSAVNPEGGHPHIVEGAFLWGFDIRSWQKHLNPLTWPEILRQFALSAGFGPKLKRKAIDRASPNDIKETKGCEEIVSTLRNGSAAESAVAVMQEKGLTLQRKSRHRLTPGTVKFAAYHVLALEGGKGLNVIDIAEKIQKSGLRDLTTSKTPEASISVALSRDPILFERTAPSTYCVRPAFRKDPADADSIIASAKEKILRYANGFAADRNADEEERDDDSDSDVADGTEGDAVAIPLNADNIDECKEMASSSGNCKNKLTGDAILQDAITSIDTGNRISDLGVEIDESRSGEAWVLCLSEGEYSDLSVEERLNALVTLIGIANEGNSIRVILEERMDSSNALKKQMWAEAQLDKRRIREEFIVTKFHDPSAAVIEGGLSPSVAENRIDDLSATTTSVLPDSLYNSLDNPVQDIFMGQYISSAQQNGHVTERSRLQLKSYIGHRAEELYIYRSLPLGQDRRRNRYWLFVASASCVDPSSGRIFVESPDGNWKLIDSVEAFDSLLTSLDTRGTRESHLHIMLQKIEGCFKECIRRNCLSHNVFNGYPNNIGQDSIDVNSSLSHESVESLHGAVSGTNFDTLEPSSSFRIDIGQTETEINHILKRHEDLHTWIMKECCNSSILCAKACDEKRCSPLFGICDICLSTYDMNTSSCPFCQRGYSKQVGQEKYLLDGTDKVMDDSSPPRVRLVKTILALLEATVPSEALHSSWTEERRKTWGLQLHSTSSVEGLLQILTQLEGAIKRDHLSADFETTEELLCYYDPSRGSGKDFNDPGSVPPLPWLPKSTAAVALRLLELDESIYYHHNQMADSLDKKQTEALPNFALRYCYQDILKAESMDFDGQVAGKEETWVPNPIRKPPGSSGSQPVARGRGGGRPRGKSQKGVVRSISQSSRRIMKRSEMLTESLLKQGIRATGQSHGRGRRTVRRRRTEKSSTVADTLGSYGKATIIEHEMEEPRISRREQPRGFSSRNIKVANEESSNSLEAGDSDDIAIDDAYGYDKWGAAMDDVTSNQSNDMLEMSDDDADNMETENGYEEDDAEILEEDVEINDDDSGRDEEDEDEGSDSSGSGDYSD